MPKKYSVMDAEKRHSAAEAGAKKRASNRRGGSATAAESRVSKPRSANINRVTSGARGSNVAPSRNTSSIRSQESPPKRATAGGAAQIRKKEEASKPRNSSSANAAESRVSKPRSADVNRVTSGSKGSTRKAPSTRSNMTPGVKPRMGVKKEGPVGTGIRATEWAYKKAQRKANLRKKARVKTAAANRKQGQAESKAGKGRYR